MKLRTVIPYIRFVKSRSGFLSCVKKQSDCLSVHYVTAHPTVSSLQKISGPGLTPRLPEVCTLRSFLQMPWNYNSQHSFINFVIERTILSMQDLRFSRSCGRLAKILHGAATRITIHKHPVFFAPISCSQCEYAYRRMLVYFS